jgi:hypothetical protein
MTYVLEIKTNSLKKFNTEDLVLWKAVLSFLAPSSMWMTYVFLLMKEK